MTSWNIPEAPSEKVSAVCSSASRGPDDRVVRASATAPWTAPSSLSLPVDRVSKAVFRVELLRVKCHRVRSTSSAMPR